MTHDEQGPMAARIREEYRASRPILEELAQLGYEPNDIWGLGSPGPRTYKSAIPILLKHLESGAYPHGVMMALAILLQTRDAAPYWDRVAVVYGRTDSGSLKDAIAGALAASASRKVLPDLLRLFAGNDGDRSATMFVRPILRFGGSDGRSLIQEYESDPIIGPEARAALKGKSMNED